jgi:sugar-specific transcriptional regulator TrmB
MGNQKKRLDKLSANLSAKERSIAILDAVRRDDMATAISLAEATPRKSYRSPDGAVRQTIDVVENLSLRFDRAFYSSVLVLQVADRVVDVKANEVVATIERELLAQVSGLEIFAERVGLSLERLLAFSTALENDLVKCYQRDLNTLSEEELELAQSACSAIEYLWDSLAGHSVFTVAA